jgi:hypothetical protein
MHVQPDASTGMQCACELKCKSTTTTGRVRHTYTRPLSQACILLWLVLMPLSVQQCGQQPMLSHAGSAQQMQLSAAHFTIQSQSDILYRWQRLIFFQTCLPKFCVAVPAPCTAHHRNPQHKTGCSARSTGEQPSPQAKLTAHGGSSC